MFIAGVEVLTTLREVLAALGCEYVLGLFRVCVQLDMTEDEKRLPTDERAELEKQLSCFVPCNAKATNIYRARWALAYCCNMHFHPMIRRFFTDGNDKRERMGLSGIYPDEDLYALSCLVQWIFRSRIRDGEGIEIYVPNRRMRDLLTAWLDLQI